VTRVAARIPWEKGKSGNYVTYTSPSGKVIIQDTIRPGQARFQVVTFSRGRWYESADAPSLKEAFKVAQNDEKIVSREEGEPTRRGSMDTRRVAMRLVKLAKELVAAGPDFVSEDEWLKETKDSVKGFIEFAKKHGGKVSKWKLGDGWKQVIEYNVNIRMPNGGYFYAETSESCILYALSLLCKDLGLSFRKITGDSTAGLDEWKGLCSGLPSKWDAEDVEALYEDLEDVNYHDESGKLRDEAEAAGIL